MKFKKVANDLILAVAVTASFTTFANAKIITDFDETKIQAPFVDSNDEPLIGTVCKTRDNLRWDYCSTRYENGQEQMKSFKFSNIGENKIIPKSGFGVGRDYEFLFEGFARSDLGLLVWDMPDETESHGHLKLMMFFPRLVIPAIRYESDSEKDILIVTLPTKEEVVFNGKSRELISGVMTEAMIKQDSAGNALNPAVHYTGSGVVVEADRLNDYPVGLSAQSNKNNSATIKKKGFKDCKIPVRELWYTDDNKGGNIFFNKKYITDKAFDVLLKQKCHFSMY
jgi:hypothetical protein